MLTRPDRQVRLGSLWSRVALPPLRAEEQQGFTAYFAEQTILSLLIAMPITALLHLFMIGLGVSLFPEQKLTISAYHLSIAFGSAGLFLLARTPVTAAYLPANGVYVWLYSAACAAVTLVLLEQGVFLYIGACELVPRSYGGSPRPFTTAATLLGMTIMYGVIALS